MARVGTDGGVRAATCAGVSGPILLIELRSLPKKTCSRQCADTSITWGVRGSFCNSSGSRRPGPLVRTEQTSSVPPELRLTHVVSGRRASASPMEAAASGVHRMRTTHEESPSRIGSVSPRTLSFPADRSRDQRRAAVWSDTPNASPISLNEARPLI